MNDMLICPSCGKETEKLIRNVCPECFLEKFSLFEMPLVFHVRVCPQCGAFYHKNRWEDGDGIENVIMTLSQEALFIHADVDNVAVGMQPVARSPYIYDLYVDVDGTVEGIPVYRNGKTEVRVKREACDMCSRKAGGYFEAIIQFRGTNRTPTKEELAECRKITFETMEQMDRKGDKLAFVSEILELKEGTDYYLGSTNAARHLCKRIIELFGGTVAESYTLAGMKDGKETYRTTFAMRLPEFRKGDVIYYDGKVIEVRSCGRRTTGICLADGTGFFEESDTMKNVRLLGNIADAVDAVLISEEENAIMVLDPVSFETVTIRKPLVFNALAGSEIKVFRSEFGLFAL